MKIPDLAKEMLLTILLILYSKTAVNYSEEARFSEGLTADQKLY